MPLTDGARELLRRGLAVPWRQMPRSMHVCDPSQQFAPDQKAKYGAVMPEIAF